MKDYIPAYVIIIILRFVCPSYLFVFNWSIANLWYCVSTAKWFNYTIHIFFQILFRIDYYLASIYV